MAAEVGLTVNMNQAQSIDFANQFGLQVGNLVKLLGVQRKIALSCR